MQERHDVARPKAVAISAKKECHCESVTDVTGVAIRPTCCHCEEGEARRGNPPRKKNVIARPKAVAIPPKKECHCEAEGRGNPQRKGTPSGTLCYNNIPTNRVPIFGMAFLVIVQNDSFAV